MGIGKKIQAVMERRGLKQADLARAVNAPKTTICSIINNDNSRISISLFLNICRYLECEPFDFLDEESAPVPVTAVPPRLANAIERMNAEGIEEVCDFAELCASKDKYKKHNTAIPADEVQGA